MKNKIIYIFIFITTLFIIVSTYAYIHYFNNDEGVVPFSGKEYWDNGECVRSALGGYNCPGTSGLKSEYANSANVAGTSIYDSPYPNVYNNTMSSIAPSTSPYYMNGNAWHYAENNGYTIAYYVEKYLRTLKNLGAPNNITGRLLTYEEALSLSSTVKGNGAYWLDSAFSKFSVWFMEKGSLYNNNSIWSNDFCGVRPVIVVSTSDIES